MCAIRFFFSLGEPKPQKHSQEKQRRKTRQNFRIESEKRGSIIIRVQKTLKFATEGISNVNIRRELVNS